MREQRLCPGTRINCPSCGGVLLNASLRNGDAFYRCARNLARTGPRRTCGQHFYVLCTARLCSVWEVSPEERQRFEADQSTPDEILAALGVQIAKAA